MKFNFTNHLSAAVLWGALIAAATPALADAPGECPDYVIHVQNNRCTEMWDLWVPYNVDLYLVGDANGNNRPGCVADDRESLIFVKLKESLPQSQVAVDPPPGLKTGKQRKRRWRMTCAESLVLGDQEIPYRQCVPYAAGDPCVQLGQNPVDPNVSCRKLTYPPDGHWEPFPSIWVPYDELETCPEAEVAPDETPIENEVPPSREP